MIHIGCSGWSYPEWVGPFYPRGTKDKLEYYSTVFNTVELNSSFYGDISPKLLNSWIRRFSGTGFRFSVKAPRTMTHEAISQGSEQALFLMDKFLEDTVWPMRDSGILGMTLFQIPPFYGEKEINNLSSVFDDSDINGINPRVEIRNTDILNSITSVKSILNRNSGLVIPDSPDFLIDSGNVLQENWDYVRLHGRNISSWDSKGQGMARYDYLYTEDELRSIWTAISKHSADDIFVYFNNHPGGRATRNAILMMDLAGVKGDRTKLF